MECKIIAWRLEHVRQESISKFKTNNYLDLNYVTIHSFLYIQCKSEAKFGPSPLPSSVLPHVNNDTHHVYKFIPSIEITVNWKSTKLLKVKKNYRSFWFSVVIPISSSEIKDLCYEWRVVVKKRFGSFFSLFDKVERTSRDIKSSS